MLFRGEQIEYHVFLILFKNVKNAWGLPQGVRGHAPSPDFTRGASNAFGPRILGENYVKYTEKMVRTVFFLE